MKNIYEQICSSDNLFLAYQKARKNKTRKHYVLEFEKYLEQNLADLRFELQTQIYSPEPLTTFILRDPKTRKISKSDFRDRIVHHAIVNILEPIFEKSFIYDSCANRKSKGTLFAIRRFDKFKRKATHNLVTKIYCLKADIRHYFQEVDHEILFSLIKRKISDAKTLWLVKRVIKANSKTKRERE
jgi:RNA-directed DNA polymerase